MKECQVRSGNSWRMISADDPAGDSGELRCIECHGPIRFHKMSEDGTQAAHFEHQSDHGGCSLGRGFSGRLSRHPDSVD
jgi:hypothetical protein